MTDWKKEVDKLGKYLLLNYSTECEASGETCVDVAIRLLEVLKNIKTSYVKLCK